MKKQLKTGLFYLSHTYLLILLFLFSLFRQGPLYDIDIPYFRWSWYASVVAVITLGVYYLLRLFIKDKYKASLFTSLIVINFLFYKNLVQFINVIYPRTELNQFADNYFDLVPTLFIVIINILVIGLLSKQLAGLKHVAGYLTLLVAFFLMNEIVQLGIALKHKKYVSLENVTPQPVIATVPLTAKQPDIYYFIADSYTSNESLKKYFEFDNIQFCQFLKQNGFYIADKAKANYNITIPSITSSLNSSYLGIDNKAKFTLKDLLKMCAFINQNQLVRYLKEQGYAIYSWNIYDFNNKKNEDFTINLNPGFRTFIDYTILAPLSSYIKSKSSHTQLKRLQDINKFYLYNTHSLEFILKHRKVLRSSQPKLFFIHSLVTHPPFVFTPSGKKLIDKNLNDNPKLYPHQIAYFNKQLQTIIKLILAESGNPPIIVIQGDHGSHFKGLEESQTILNAYYFPDKNYQNLYPSISPVNTFRVICNQYFNTDLPLLPDKHYQVFYGTK